MLGVCLSACVCVMVFGMYKLKSYLAVSEGENEHAASLLLGYEALQISLQCPGREKAIEQSKKLNPNVTEEQLEDMASKLLMSGFDSHGLGSKMDLGERDEDDHDALGLRADVNVGSLQDLAPRSSTRRSSGKQSTDADAEDADMSDLEGADSETVTPRGKRGSGWFDVASETQKIKRVYQTTISKMKSRMKQQYDQMKAQLDVCRNTAAHGKDLVGTKIVHNRAEALMIIMQKEQLEWVHFCDQLAKTAENVPLAMHMELEKLHACLATCCNSLRKCNILGSRMVLRRQARARSHPLVLSRQ